MKRRIFSVVLLLAMVINFLPICSPVANAVVLAPALTDFDVIGANGWVYVVSQTSGYYYKLSDESGSAPVLDSSDLDGYATKYDITRFLLEECPNGTTKYVQVIKVVSGKIKAWGQKAVTPQPMVEYNGSIDAHGLAITLEQGDNPSKTKIFLDSDKTTPAAIFFPSSAVILAADPDGAYNLSDIMIYGNRLATNSVTTTSITMNGGSVKSIYGGSGITSSASIVINGGSFIFIRGDGSMGNETHRADIVINGGNVSNTVFTGGAVGVKSGTNSTITVNGGYIRKGYPPYNSAFIEGATPKNSDGDVVKKYILTVKNGGEAVTGAAISALTTYPELGYTYGLADVKTDLNGNLLVFLPEGVCTVSVVADGQTYWGIVTSNAATLMPRSTAPTADVTSITKVTAEQQSVSYTLTNSPQLSGTCTVYADNTTTAPISTVTAAISGSDMTLTSSGADIAAGDYYVAVTETNKSESARLKLTIINIDDADNSEYITGASVAITAPVIGANPQDAAAVQAATNNADYTVTGLVWNGPLTAGDKFKADQIYTATVTLESKNGKKFQSEAFTPTVAGSSSVGTTNTSGGDVIGNTVSFTITFAATGSGGGSGGGGGGGSGNNTPVPPPLAPVITVSEVKSELFENTEDIKVEADVTSAFGQSVEVKITDSTESQNEIFSLAGADDKVYPFDISLYSKESSQKLQPKDGYSVKITLPVPEKLLEDRGQIKVVYGKDGILETLKSELIEKDGKWYIIFEATHFSPYALVVSAEPEPSVSWTNPFSDVKEGDWYYSAVQYVSQNGLMLGTGSNTFSPQLTTNRGMIASILYRLNGTDETSESTFKDVIPGAYYAKAVAWAQGKGIIAGYGNGMFGPEDSITREQMATILWRYAGSPVAADSTGLNTFKDAVEISSYAKNALAWTHQKGIIAGKGNGILDPKGYATRAEVAQIMYNFIQKADLTE
ncbi:MAG: S-layer homology domain-containing protein [Clostridiaceae bacterium]|nr:S-layer homology domain-containing protein [Clostridiaceae bacterium]